MQDGPLLKDATLIQSHILPVGATSVNTDAIDTKNTTTGDFVANVEFLLNAPALATGALPDTKTITYDIITSVNSDLSSPTVLMPGVIVQTGAGGSGASAAEYQFKLPFNTKRYVGAKATGVATVSAAGSSMTLGARF